ncbi:hypothetical protein [Streptomyces sp. NPDC090026]|uniref:hypothetical protein n=1 Tax=Streptomyces sp. NPDC090026 TaxID=3365923 RepID=UPI0038212BFF
MNPGDRVWLRGGDDFVSDANGRPIDFQIVRQRSHTSGAWHELTTEHRIAQEIYGGWHTAPRLAYAMPDESETR